MSHMPSKKKNEKLTNEQEINRKKDERKKKRQKEEKMRNRKINKDRKRVKTHISKVKFFILNSEKLSNFKSH